MTRLISRINEVGTLCSNKVNKYSTRLECLCARVCVCKGCKLNARVLMATSTSYTMRGLGMCSESRK